MFFLIYVYFYFVYIISIKLEYLKPYNCVAIILHLIGILDII